MTDASKHAARVQKRSQPEALDLKLEYSPEMRRAFARLEAAIYDSPHCDGGILENLEMFSEKHPWPLQSVLTGIATVVREAMKHVAATGDQRAEGALTDLMVLLGDEKPPVSLASKRDRNFT